MFKKTILPLWLLLSLVATPAISQNYFTQGTDFWVSFMRNFQPTNSIYNIVIANSQSGTVTGMIRNRRQGVEIPFSVNANSSVTVNIDRAIVENLVSGNIRDHGLQVTSSAPVNVYAFHFDLNGSSDAAIVLPYPTLGDDYTIVTYSERDLAPNNQMESAFLIVATEDETTVEITPSTPLSGVTGSTAGVPFTVELQEGQSVMYNSFGTSTTQVNDVTGTRVRVVGGCKSVAVFGGHHASTAGGNCSAITPTADHLFAQITPTATWGRDYLLPVLAESPQTMFRIYAPTAGTVVTIDNIAHTFPRPNGSSILDTTLENFTALNPSGVYWLSSTQPVGVCQVGMGANCTGIPVTDPFLVFLAPTDAMLATTTQVYVPADPSVATARNYMTVIVREAETGNVQLDGLGLAGWQPVLEFYPGGPSTGYAAGTIDLTIATQTLTSSGMLAYAYGYGVTPPGGGAPQNSFGYLLAGGFATIPPVRLQLTGAQDISCFGRNDGELTVEVEYGRAPYTLTLDSIDGTNFITLRTEALAAAGSFTFTGLYSGNYRILLQDDLLCSKETEQFLAQPERIRPGGDAHPNNRIEHCRSERTFTLPDARPAGGTWSGTGVVPGTNQFSFDLLAQAGGGSLSTLYLRYSLGVDCRDSVLLTILEDCEQLSIPNVFTPNGDGYNDTWYPRMAETREYKLIVYSRYGHEVFQTNNPIEVWRGEAKGSEAPPGVYFYTLEGVFLSNIEFKRTGTVTLLR
ncbi:MAG: gliding motility-associated C-terminal domain-containing protein [Bacteroidetes bacterium]|nr:gliding motility-associated C-terminal domain-containing protein [Bacteroidota bacterium]